VIILVVEKEMPLARTLAWAEPTYAHLREFKNWNVVPNDRNGRILLKKSVELTSWRLIQSCLSNREVGP
jgi:hypothetical protein